MATRGILVDGESVDDEGSVDAATGTEESGSGALVASGACIGSVALVSPFVFAPDANLGSVDFSAKFSFCRLLGKHMSAVFEELLTCNLVAITILTLYLAIV